MIYNSKMLFEALPLFAPEIFITPHWGCLKSLYLPTVSLSADKAGEDEPWFLHKMQTSTALSLLDLDF